MKYTSFNDLSSDDQNELLKNLFGLCYTKAELRHILLDNRIETMALHTVLLSRKGTRQLIKILYEKDIRK